MQTLSMQPEKAGRPLPVVAEVVAEVVAVAAAVAAAVAKILLLIVVDRIRNCCC